MLNTLEQILKKRGLEAVEEFLSEEITITEKLDTYRILFENVDGELKFFKKDNTELNLIERILTNIWEDAIIELSIILDKVNLPENIHFGVAYTPVNKPIRLLYENLPKYVLTDVTKRHGINKVKEIFDYNEVTEWSKKLNLARPPIIFQGVLSEDQKNELIKYASSNYGKEIKLEKIIENSYSDAEIIEGIIIKGENQLVQIESYEFALLNETYQKIESSRDFYDLTLLRMNSFMDKYNFPILEGNNSDDLYLELVCDIFNNYCNGGNISEDLDPVYLSPPSYGYAGNLNLLLIKNKDTIKILEKGNKIHESVFKIMLSSFRKYKKPYGLLRESDVQKFNTYIYFINEKTKGTNLGKIPTVELITEAGSENIVVREVEKKIKTDVDNMRVIASVQKAFKPQAPELPKGKEKCVVYVTDPQPFTNNQKENVENLVRMWKAPVILAFVKGEKREEGKLFHLSDQLKRSQLETFADNNQRMVCAFFSLESWDLVEVFEYCRPKYEPIAIITDSDKKSEFVLQLYFEDEVMGGRIGVERDLNIGEMENKEELLAYRTIEDDNFVNFKELTPAPIWNLFNSMASEYKEWNGSVLPQFELNKFELEDESENN